MSEDQYIQLPLEFEIWKPIPDYDGRYEASSEGRIRRVKEKMGKGQWRDSIISTHVASKYERIGIMRNDGTAQQIGVHQLIALAFLGPCPEGMEIDHIDLDKMNNRASNLEYVTHAENLRRARATKSWGPPKGIGKKLTIEDIEDIRTSTLSQRKIAEWKGISQPLVCMIRSGKVWK